MKIQMELSRKSVSDIVDSFYYWPGNTFEAEQEEEDKKWRKKQKSHESMFSFSSSQSVLRSRFIFINFLSDHRAGIQKWTYFLDEIHFYTDLIDSLLVWLNRGDSPISVSFSSSSALSFLPSFFTLVIDLEAIKRNTELTRHLLQAQSYLLSCLNYMGAEQTLCTAYHSVACLSRRETLNYSNYSFAAEALFRLYRQTFPFFDATPSSQSNVKRTEHKTIKPTEKLNSKTNPGNGLNDIKKSDANVQEDVHENVQTDEASQAWWLEYGVIPREWRTADHRIFFPALFNCRREITSEFDYLLMGIKGRIGRDSGKRLKKRNSDIAYKINDMNENYNHKKINNHYQTKPNGTEKNDEVNAKLDNRKQIYKRKKRSTIKMKNPNFQKSFETEKEVPVPAINLSSASFDPSLINFSNSPCAGLRKNESKLNDTLLLSEHELWRVHRALKSAVGEVEDGIRRSRNIALVVVLVSFLYVSSAHFLKCIIKIVLKMKKNEKKCHSLLQRRTSNNNRNDHENISKPTPLLYMERFNNEACLDDEYIYNSSSQIPKNSSKHKNLFFNKKSNIDDKNKQLKFPKNPKLLQPRHVKISEAQQTTHFATLPHKPHNQFQPLFSQHSTLHPKTLQNKSPYLPNQVIFAQNNDPQQNQLFKPLQNSIFSTNFWLKKSSKSISEDNNTLSSIVEMPLEENSDCMIEDFHNNEKNLSIKKYLNKNKIIDKAAESNVKTDLVSGLKIATV